MEEILKCTSPAKVQIKEKTYTLVSKTEYTLVEDSTAKYYKCELDNGEVLVIIPDDKLCYIGAVLPNMTYQHVSEQVLNYNDKTYHKTGSGHQIITKIDFGDKDSIEGECDFEDFESEDNTSIISLGILENQQRADVLANIIEPSDIKLVEQPNSR